MTSRFPLALATVALILAGTVSTLPALGGAQPVARTAILQRFASEAKALDASFAGFSAERGAAFYAARQSGGGIDTPSCTTCHGPSPTDKGQTRAGKPIEPMAVSVIPDRFTDPAKVDKWFERNCQSVLGRVCTPLEKGDVLTFLIGR